MSEALKADRPEQADHFDYDDIVEFARDMGQPVFDGPLFGKPWLPSAWWCDFHAAVVCVSGPTGVTFAFPARPAGCPRPGNLRRAPFPQGRGSVAGCTFRGGWEGLGPSPCRPVGTQWATTEPTGLSWPGGVAAARPESRGRPVEPVVWLALPTDQRGIRPEREARRWRCSLDRSPPWSRIRGRREADHSHHQDMRDTAS